MINKTVIGFLGGIIGTSATFSQVEGMNGDDILAASKNEETWKANNYQNVPTLMDEKSFSAKVPENAYHLYLDYLSHTNDSVAWDGKVQAEVRALESRGADRGYKQQIAGKEGSFTAAEYARLLYQDMKNSGRPFDKIMELLLTLSDILRF
ncbi:MAG: hypothetical protein LBF54_03035 [Holosporaceae bacterium]|nr:hypothetical protein [Holosporaceae bacterium]